MDDKTNTERFEALPNAVQEILLDFAEAWVRVPLLVQASTAVSMYDHLRYRASQLGSLVEPVRMRGLDRRANVDAWAAHAYEQLSEMFADLTRVADDQIVRLDVADSLGLDSHPPQDDGPLSYVMSVRVTKDEEP